MPEASKLSNEQARLASLHSYQILDTANENDFDHITSLAALVCQAPMALITLIDEDRHWFKSSYGLDSKDIPKRSAFCSHTITMEEGLVIEDTLLDPRVSDCHLVLGEPFIRFYAGRPLIVEEGHAIGTLCVLDVKPRTLSASQLEALRHLSEQVIRLLELRKTYFRLNREERLREDLTNMTVHDLRSPLSAVSMNLESFLRDSVGLVSEELRKDVSDSLMVIHSLVEMVSSILDVSRMEGGMMPIDRSEIDLTRVAKAAIDRVKGQDSRVRLLSDSPVPAFCDGSLFTRVIANLVSNALTHAGRGTEIDVHVGHHEGMAEVSVTDQGKGIPRERCQRIFQKFGSVQGDPKSRAYSTGFGLPFCKMLVQAHDGVIGVDSEVGRGSRFWFKVPLKDRSEHLQATS